MFAQQRRVLLRNENGALTDRKAGQSGERGDLIGQGDQFREAVAPVFDDLYESVASGEETRIVLKANSAPDYREKLEAELREMRESEMWQAGAAVRSLRPGG